MEFPALHEKAQRCAEQYRRNEAELIGLLQQIDPTQGYKALGYSSLHAYVVGALHLSEDQAYQFTRVARKAKEVPELKTALDQGVLNVSKARRILSVIQPTNSHEWIAKAAALKQRDLEREVAQVAPRTAVAERMRPVAPDVVEFRSAIDSKTEALLRRVQHLESRRTSKAASWNDTLAAMATLYLERRDPLKKAERAQARKPTPILSQGQTGRYVPAHVAHQVSLRDRGQCTFTGTHGKCRESRWVHVHHVTPVSMGGTSTLDNLTTFCASHHRYLHAEQRVPVAHDRRRVPSAAGRMAGDDPL